MWIYNYAKQISKNQDIPIFTFKCFEDQVPEFTRGYHFGNTAGLNRFTGKECVIIGTPFYREEAYKLAAAYMGADANGDDVQGPRNRRVSYNGYSFRFMSYQDETLQHVQLYMMNYTPEDSGNDDTTECAG